mgnify:CR=1 FL=1
MAKSKRLLAAILAGLMSVTALTACKPGDSSSGTGNSTKSDGSKDDTNNTAEEGKVLNIYCWNNEFQQRVEGYAQDIIDEFESNGGTVNWIITPNAENAYQNKLDGDLMNQEYIDADEKIDIFLVEADYALKYVNRGVSADVKDLGLTDDDMSQMYEYTKEVMTSTDGKIKGVSWQATPGLFAYRRDIAKEVLGTDEPDKVQEVISDWTKFDETAAKMKDKGYFMLAGYDDSYRTFSNNVSSKWVDDSNTIVIDDAIKQWVDQTKTYTDKGYNNKASLWSDEWAKEQSPEGKTFGFFYSTWGIDFTLLGNSLATAEEDGGKLEKGNGLYGEWAVTYGPQSYFWGGTWICAYSQTDNKEVIAKLMKRLTCDGETAKKITEGTQDFTNNVAAMEELANSDFQSAFLGGQNHLKLFAEVAKNIKMDKTTAYDQGLNESFQGAMKDYFNPDNKDVDTYEKALENFYEKALAKYPDLKKPA